MTVESVAALLGVAAVVITALAALVKAFADLIGARGKKDTAPAPQLGITATPPASDDIDYRAYLDMKERAERAEESLRRFLNRGDHIDEDTQPLDPT
ncbi:hypothetical protein [Microbacterium oleivorans]|uniref:Uncharacterized protein n=1 Tax=Microbacterium oleivorans TaxID=273677 RepID=A0A7D5INI0_9MICO|nr:hypothetical protein [Microbacterium oleivorans]QLD10879.1 hypothetical protein HW566_03225 [Microbacterium oleivorans]